MQRNEAGRAAASRALFSTLALQLRNDSPPFIAFAVRGELGGSWHVLGGRPELMSSQEKLI